MYIQYKYQVTQTVINVIAMFVEVIIGIVALLLIWDYLNKKRRNEILETSKIPGPKALPLIGNALEFRGLTTEGIFDFAKKNCQKYGKIHRFWMLHQLNVVVLDVKYIEVILSSQEIIKKSVIYDLTSPWLGDGLLLSNGQKWHNRRKIITPTFHFKILEQFIEIFDQQSAIMVKKLYEKADGKTPVNMFPIVCLTGLDIIAETAMGVKVNAQGNPDMEYVKALSDTAKIMSNRFINPFQRTNWLFYLTAFKTARKLNKSIKIMHNFTNKVIEQRRAALKKSVKDGTYQPMNSNDDIGLKKRMALLDVLLQSTVGGKPLTNEDIREEVDTFMFEGHDTTTSGISYCLYAIARHPEVQRKLISEITSVIGVNKHKPISYRELQDLKYLECVIKESLRLYPSVPGISRETEKDFICDDLVIPAKTIVSISFYMILRDPDNFPNPNDFIPERFSETEATKYNPFAYTPFSAGPRNCIGQKFAMLEMKSTISKVLRHFELLPLGPQVRPMVNLVLRSVTGVHIGLKSRS